MKQIIEMVTVFIVAPALLLGAGTLLAGMAQASMATEDPTDRIEVPVVHYGRPSDSWLDGRTLTRPRHEISLVEHSVTEEPISPKCSTVPVPPSVWLLAGGLIGLVGIRRRWRK